MSLRDKNKGALVTTGDQAKGALSGTLRKAAVSRPTGRGLAAVQKATAKSGPSMGKGNIGFVFDATGSRMHVWEPAKKGFEQMFRSLHAKGIMKLRFMDFGNEGDVVDREWTDDVEKICQEAAAVECRGGTTQINDCLRRFVSDQKGEKVNSIIYVGDHYEECYGDDDPQLDETISIMKENGIKVFTFLDSDCDRAERTYRKLSEATGGKFARFGDDLPLEDLCEGVALMTVGGESALQRLQNAAARQLLLTATPKP